MWLNRGAGITQSFSSTENAGAVYGILYVPTNINQLRPQSTGPQSYTVKPIQSTKKDIWKKQPLQAQICSKSSPSTSHYDAVIDKFCMIAKEKGITVTLSEKSTNITQTADSCKIVEVIDETSPLKNKETISHLAEAQKISEKKSSMESLIGNTTTPLSSLNPKIIEFFPSARPGFRDVGRTSQADSFELESYKANNRQFVKKKVVPVLNSVTYKLAQKPKIFVDTDAQTDEDLSLCSKCKKLIAASDKVTETQILQKIRPEHKVLYAARQAALLLTETPSWIEKRFEFQKLLLLKVTSFCKRVDLDFDQLENDIICRIAVDLLCEDPELAMIKNSTTYVKILREEISIQLEIAHSIILDDESKNTHTITVTEREEKRRTICDLGQAKTSVASTLNQLATTQLTSYPIKSLASLGTSQIVGLDTMMGSGDGMSSTTSKDHPDKKDLKKNEWPRYFPSSVQSSQLSKHETTQYIASEGTLQQKEMMAEQSNANSKTIDWFSYTSGEQLKKDETIFSDLHKQELLSIVNSNFSIDGNDVKGSISLGRGRRNYKKLPVLDLRSKKIPQGPQAPVSNSSENISSPDDDNTINHNLGNYFDSDHNTSHNQWLNKLEQSSCLTLWPEIKMSSINKNPQINQNIFNANTCNMTEKSDSIRIDSNNAASTVETNNVKFMEDSFKLSSLHQSSYNLHPRDVYKNNSFYCDNNLPNVARPFFQTLTTQLDATNLSQKSSSFLNPTSNSTSYQHNKTEQILTDVDSLSDESDSEYKSLPSSDEKPNPPNFNNMKNTQSNNMGKYGLDDISLMDKGPNCKVRSDGEHLFLSTSDSWLKVGKGKDIVPEDELINFRITDKYSNLVKLIMDKNQQLTKTEAQNLLDLVYLTCNGIKGMRQHQILAEVSRAVQELYPDK